MATCGSDLLDEVTGIADSFRIPSGIFFFDFFSSRGEYILFFEKKMSGAYTHTTVVKTQQC
jgi:hypothetical protein